MALIDEALYLPLAYYDGRAEHRNRQPFEIKRGESKQDASDRLDGFCDERDGVSVKERLSIIKRASRLPSEILDEEYGDVDMPPEVITSMIGGRY
jgi:hypothetical protein